MSEHGADNRMWMTPMLNSIAEIAGEQAALLLGREKAGQQVYIPSTVTADHWLTDLVGIDAASAIAAHYGSQKIVLPAALSGDKRRRAAAIAEMTEKGYSLNKIVRLTGLSRSTVQSHMKRHRPDSAQGSLF